MTEQWHIAGEYLESCNCAFLCPCLLGPRNARGGAMARPTEGHCDVPLVFRVEAGTYGDVALDGTHAAVVIYTPGPMGEGGWTVGVYVDEAGTAAQREALEAIFTGKAGGVMALLSPLVATWLPLRTAPITCGAEGRRRWAAIPGILDIEIEGVEGRGGGESQVWLDNVKHFVASRLAAAKTVRGRYHDHGFDWDSAGRNAHYARFDWSSR